jgi:3-oxoacyl-[acyl-carrier protein] reductase
VNILIIGGSRGIGKSMVETFKKQGHKILFTYNSTVPQIEDSENLIALPLDVSCESAISDFCSKISSHLDSLDVFIYNSGISEPRLILYNSADAFDKTMDINLRGATIFLRHIGEIMMMQRSGKMFFLSSVNAEKSARGHMNYAVSKAGIQCMVRVAAQEFSRSGIMINAIAPGVVESDMTESTIKHLKEAGKYKELMERIAMRRIAKPQEIANFVASLSQPEITYITGQTFSIDGGYQL